MINVRIKIGEGNIEDIFTHHDLIYKDSDDITEAPIKNRYTSSYAEEAGNHTDPRTVQDAFDYNVRFVIDSQDTNIENVNAIVERFNQQLYTQEDGSDIRTYKKVTFYNDFKRVTIVGIPNPIAKPKEMFRTKGGHDYAEIEFTIHVSDPGLCDFSSTIIDDGIYKVIACAGASSRNNGHYLCANADGTLAHKNDVNELMLWEIGDIGQYGRVRIYNVGAKAYLNGTTKLQKDNTSVCFVYDSPAVRNSVGFNSQPNQSTGSNYGFINALNTGTGVGTYILDAGSSFVIVPYSHGDGDADLQKKVNDALANG